MDGGGTAIVTKYVYTMKVSPEKLLDLIESTIGRRPDEIGKSGLHTWSFTFLDTDISAQDRSDAQAALPDGIRLLYGFTREVVVEE